MSGERLWLAVVYPIGLADVFGAGWDRDHLHSDRESALAEAMEMATDLGLSPIQWNEVTDNWAIGRCHSLASETSLYGVTVRGVLPP